MRYIPMKAAKYKNELIPLWDSRIKYENTDMYGEVFKYDNNYSHCRLVDCVFDTKNKKLVAGIQLDYYPKSDNLPYAIGETIYREVKSGYLIEDKIVDVKFEKFDREIKLGKDFYENYQKELNLDPKVIYDIKIYEPTYVMQSGEEVSYTYQLYKKVDAR